MTFPRCRPTIMTAITLISLSGVSSFSFLLAPLLLPQAADAFFEASKTSTLRLLRPSHHHHHVKLHASSSSTITPKTFSRPSSDIDSRIPINESYPGLQCIHSNPDIYIISQFLSPHACDDLITRAKQKGTQRSPVAYAGWTTDIKDLLGLAASGPVSWIAILSAWYEETQLQAENTNNASVVNLVIHSLRNFSVLFVLAAILIAIFTKVRADGLQELRTSTSTTLDDLSSDGVREFVLRASDLFEPTSSLSSSSSNNEEKDENDDDIMSSPASFFEAPTVINYEKDQALAPHFDANRSASVEDVNRGGQTLSTLIVYLNDVRKGGTTRFGKLPAISSSSSSSNKNDVVDDIVLRQMINDPNLNIIPRKGDALLFFPADKYGNFDERTEHEGCPAVDEKWIARIWRHEGRVPPPFGLSDDCIREYC